MARQYLSLQFSLTQYLIDKYCVKRKLNELESYFFCYYRVYLYNIEINSTKNHDYGYILLSVYPGQVLPKSTPLNSQALSLVKRFPPQLIAS